MRYLKFTVSKNDFSVDDLSILSQHSSNINGVESTRGSFRRPNHHEAPFHRMVYDGPLLIRRFSEPNVDEKKHENSKKDTRVKTIATPP